MKVIVVLAFCLSLLGACSSPKNKISTSDSVDLKSVDGSDELILNTQKSLIFWKGSKPIGEHDGTVKIQKGSLKIKENEIVGGNFTIDLNAIVCLDQKDQEMNNKLVSHLKSPDFFDVGKFPVGEFEITNVVKNNTSSDYPYTVSGNLKLKEKSKNISFKAKINISDGSLSAESESFSIDRTEWGVNYGSKKIFENLKDKFIHDNMTLLIKIVCNKKAT